ncbi:MAG: hypothetical protein LBD41_00780, partial [Clostridiales Family XIII bacterium]|nr:hypothetical protein [Clostridiales Family XIII bacterium]
SLSLSGIYNSIGCIYSSVRDSLIDLSSCLKEGTARLLRSLSIGCADSSKNNFLDGFSPCLTGEEPFFFMKT